MIVDLLLIIVLIKKGSKTKTENERGRERKAIAGHQPEKSLIFVGLKSSDT